MLKIINNNAFKLFKNKFIQMVTEPLIPILKRLLSWNPEERHYKGEPWRYFIDEAYFNEFKNLKETVNPKFDHVYGKHGILMGKNDRSNELIVNMSRLPFLQSKMCTKCTNTAKLICECCGKLFCFIHHHN